MSCNNFIINLINKNNEKIESLEKKFLTIEKKLDLILEILNTDLKQNCEKMGDHIDFVEKVYDNVKNPLGFICNKINFLAKDKDYNLCEEKEIWSPRTDHDHLTLLKRTHHLLEEIGHSDKKGKKLYEKVRTVAHNLGISFWDESEEESDSEESVGTPTNE